MGMRVTEAEYLVSNVDPGKCPEPNKPEFAFIGRSNVGKSSLINMLTGRKNLAKISGTPGKTTLISHFLINKEWFLVDLPGYGFAKRSKSDRDKWSRMTRDYLIKRSNLLCTFVLLDSRLDMQKADRDFIDWMGLAGLPFVLILTKTDKLKKNQLAINFENYKVEMLKTWEELPQMFLTSSVDKSGQEDLLGFIDKTSRLFEKD
jgi:GTP-binding protein